MTEKPGIDKNVLLITGLVVLVYAGVLNPILKKIGIKDDEEDKRNAAEAAAAETAVGWNPNYYKVKGGGLLKRASTEALANTIYKAAGYFNDDEEAVYGALRALPTQAALSYLADVFFQVYKQDLYGYIRDMFNDTEMAQVHRIVSKLPVK